MEIKLQVDDIELFAKALNNAVIAYNEIVWALKLECDVPKKFKSMRTLSEEELDNRINCLKNAYEQVEKIERSIKND